MDKIASINIYKEDGKYSIDFILYDEAAEKTGYPVGLWVDKRISKEKLDNLLNAIKRGQEVIRNERKNRLWVWH